MSKYKQANLREKSVLLFAYTHCLKNADLMFSFTMSWHPSERKKKGSHLTEGGGGQAIWAMPAWTDHFSKRGFPDCKGPQFWNGQKKIKSFQFPGEKENWMRERDLPGQPKLVWDPMNIPTKFLPRNGILCLSSKTFASNLVGEHD